MGKVEQFPINEALVKEFTELNKDKWEPLAGGGTKVLVNLSMVRMQIGWIVPKFILARGIAETAGASVTVLTWNENPLLTEFIGSFGFEHVALEKLNRRYWTKMWKAGFQTLGFWLKNTDGDGLKHWKYGNINVGISLYEDILRTSCLSTIRSVRNKICMKKIFHLLWTVYALDAYLKGEKVAFAVADDLAYHEGALIKLFHERGIRVFSSNNVSVRELPFDEKNEVIRLMTYRNMAYKKILPQVGDEAIKWSEEYLEQRFQGKNGREIDRGAFANKKVISREDMKKEFGLDASKKNAVIMAHTFTDAVYNYGTGYYFRDYYDWLEQTLMLAAGVTDVNWILKPHPTRSAYNESEDSIEAMFERLKKPHMHILSDDVSAESIKNFADVIVTIGGNAGAEFACFGIPAVIIGNPYYAGFGFTTEPEDLEAYRTCLQNIASLPPLDEEQVVTAKKVFYIRNRLDGKALHLFEDECARVLNLEYKKMHDEMALAYFASNEGTDSYNDRSLRLLIDYMKDHDLRDSDFYRQGKAAAEV